MTITPPTPATPVTPTLEKVTMSLTPQRKINKPRTPAPNRNPSTPQPQKVASDENWRTKSPGPATGWDAWQARREKGGPDRDKWKYIMPASLVTTPIPDLAADEPDNKFSTPKKVPTLTPQRTVRRSLEQIQKAAASSPLCPPPPMPRSAYKASPKPKEKTAPATVEKEKMDMKDLEQSFDDPPPWDPDADVNTLWDTLSASKESAIYEVRGLRSPAISGAEEKVKRPLFTSEDDNSRPSTPRRARSGSVSPERPPRSPQVTDTLTTPLRKKNVFEAKSNRGGNSVPSSPLPTARHDEDGFTHGIHSPNFNDEEEEENVCTSPLPLRDVSTIVPNTPIADLSPIAPSNNAEEDEDIARLSSSNPSPIATRTIQPFPTFTIEEASIEGESPVSERKAARTYACSPSSPSPFPSSPAATTTTPTPTTTATTSSSSSDFATSECFQALTSSNHSLDLPLSVTTPPSPSPPALSTTTLDPPSLSASIPPPVRAEPLTTSATPTHVLTPPAQTQPSNVLATLGGVNAFLIVFIAVLAAFLLADLF